MLSPTSTGSGSSSTSPPPNYGVLAKDMDRSNGSSDSRTRANSLGRTVLGKFRLGRKKERLTTLPEDAVSVIDIRRSSDDFPRGMSPLSEGSGRELSFKTWSGSSGEGYSDAGSIHVGSEQGSITFTLGAPHPGVDRYYMDDRASIAESTWSYHGPRRFLGSPEPAIILLTRTSL
jgi:hypothetical protein